MEHLLCLKYWSYALYMTGCSDSEQIEGPGSLTVPISQMENLRHGAVSNLPKAPQLISGETGPWTSAVWLQSPSSYPASKLAKGNENVFFMKHTESAFWCFPLGEKNTFLSCFSKEGEAPMVCLRDNVLLNCCTHTWACVCTHTHMYIIIK